MSIDIISNNPTIEQALNTELNYICYDDLNPEEQFCQWEQEVEAAIDCAREFLRVSSQDIPEAMLVINHKELLKKIVTPNLAHECALYLATQYDIATAGKNNMDVALKAQAAIRVNWDQNLLDFIRATIWQHLKKHVELNDAIFPFDSYNKTTNQIFAIITSEIYQFASKIIDNLPSRFLGY